MIRRTTPTKRFPSSAKRSQSSCCYWSSLEEQQSQRVFVSQRKRRRDYLERYREKQKDRVEGLSRGNSHYLGSRLVVKTKVQPLLTDGHLQTRATPKTMMSDQMPLSPLMSPLKKWKNRLVGSKDSSIAISRKLTWRGDLSAMGNPQTFSFVQGPKQTSVELGQRQQLNSYRREYAVLLQQERQLLTERAQNKQSYQKLLHNLQNQRNKMKEQCIKRAVQLKQLKQLIQQMSMR